MRSRISMVSIPTRSQLQTNIANIYGFSTNTLMFLENAGKKDISRFNLGPHRMCLINRLDLIEEIFQKQSQHFVKPKLVTELGADVFGTALTALDDEKWLTRRKHLSAAFTPLVIDSYITKSIHNIDENLKIIVSGQQIDIQEHFRLFFIELFCQLFMDETCGRHCSSISAAIETSLRSYGISLQLGLQLPSWLPSPHMRKMQTNMRMIRMLFDEMIKQRRTSPSNGTNVLSVLSYMQAEGIINNQQLIDELIVMVSVGAHQVTVAMSWIMYLLAIYPDYQNAIAKEAERIRGFDWTSDNGKMTLKVTGACVTESLRLFPPFFMIGREPKYNCILNGESFQRGENLIISSWLTHRDPRYYENPTDYCPERWFYPNDIPKYAYFPYGLGARTCLAQMLLKRLLPVAVAKFINKFSVQLSTGSFVYPLPRVTLGFKDRVTMVVRERC